MFDGNEINDMVRTVVFVQDDADDGTRSDIECK